MMKSLLAASCAVSVVACVTQDAAPSNIERALPTSDQVSINLPDTTTRILGQLATWYVATRDITRLFNGGSAWVLSALQAIVQTPVTKIDGDTYRWGPWSGALDVVEYTLAVHAVGDGTYTYQLSGRSKLQAGSVLTQLLSGTVDPRAGDRKATGEFLIDFDTAKLVNPTGAGDATGSVDVRYDLAQRHVDLTLMSTDALGQPVDIGYAYDETADGGDMTFALSANAGGGPALETIALRSRWLTSGAGRGDALLTGGDLGTTQATASECWDTQFGRVFYTDSVAFTPTEGTESACAFATADLPPPE